MNRSTLRAALGALLVSALLGAVHAAVASPGGPKIERDKLENGLRLVLSTQAAVPIVAITCLADGGARVDPSGKAGLAGLAGDLMSEGTERRSSEEIARLIDSLGGSFDTSSSNDWINVGAAVLSRDFETGLDLVAQSIAHPTFPQQEFDRVRGEVLGQIESAEDEPGYVAQRAFRQAVFGAAPYGHMVEGDKASLERLTREDVVEFHASDVRPERTICAIVGDVESARMKEVARRLLGEWRASQTAPPEPQPAAPPAASGLVVDKPISQANVVLGQIGVARTNPDYFAILLMNHILGGGGFTSRLMHTIRTEGGLAYSVHSSFDSTKLPGPFSIVLQTKVESAANAIQLARAEVARLHMEGASAEELEAAKDYLTGSFPLRLDSTGKLAGFLAQVEYFGLGDDYIEKYGDRVRAVTLADVQRAARTYLHPEALVQVVVGPAGQLGTAVD